MGSSQERRFRLPKEKKKKKKKGARDAGWTKIADTQYGSFAPAFPSAGNTPDSYSPPPPSPQFSND